MTACWLFTLALLIAIPLCKLAVDKCLWMFKYGGKDKPVSYEWQINNDEH